MKKRFLGVLLCLVMLLCVLATTAYADGTTVDEVKFTLEGYRTNREITKSEVTLPKIVVNKSVVTESDLEATYYEDFVVSTELITAANCSTSNTSVIASDSTEKFLQNKDYYLLVWFTPKSDNESILDGLDKDDFTLDVSSGSYTLTAVEKFKLDKTYCVEFKLPKLVDHAYFKLENYEQNRSVTALQLTLDGGKDNNPGIKFDGVYDTDYFIFTNSAEYWNFDTTTTTPTLNDYWNSFTSKITTTETLFKNGTTYYLMLRINLEEGYKDGRLMRNVTLNGREGDVFKLFRDGDSQIYGIFRLPKLGAEYIARADVTVAEPVVGALTDVPTLSSEKLTVYYYTWYKADAKRYAESDDVYDDTELWVEMEPGERFAAGYYYQLLVSLKQGDGNYEISPDVVGTINGGGEYEFWRNDLDASDILSISRVFGPLTAHEHTRRQSAANTAETTAPDTSKTDTVTSADTFDAGIALYAVLGTLSLTGSAWLTGKKRS